MSIKLMSVVWDIPLPPGEKLVLLALADQANDDGWQCWPAVETIARRSGQGERTVRRTLASLEEKQLLTRHHREGTSTQYHIHPGHYGTPANLAPLPKTTKTPANLAPKPLRTTNTKIEKRARVIPDDWMPEEFKAGTKSRAVTDGWTQEQYAEHLEAFMAHHSAKGSKFADWQAAWSTWALNSKKFGGQRGKQFTRNDEPQNPYLAAIASREASRSRSEW